MTSFLPGGRFFWAPLVVLANVPMIAVWYAHEQPLKVMLPYPGQFLFLATFFVLGAYFTTRTGRVLEALWDRALSEDEAHISEFYPGWAKPGHWRLLLAIALGVIVAIFDCRGGESPTYYLNTDHRFLIKSLDCIELVAVITCAFFLFMWCMIIVRIRVDDRFASRPPEDLPPVVRSAAMHAAVALVMFSCFAPLRAYSFTTDQDQSLPIAPYIVIGLSGIALLLVAFCFVQGRALGVGLKVLFATPVVAAAVFTSKKITSSFFGTAHPDPNSLIVFVLISLAAFLVIYTVLRDLVDPETQKIDRNNNPRKSSWTGWSVRLWWCRARRDDAE